ncbi:MAG TPA: hypothetical protein PKJ85_08605 [Nitrosomonas nitrosa]|nr:hypothetical protein [Nitrosomonas nitrosa]
MQQIKLLREELVAVYSRAKEELGDKAASWKSIAACIEEEFEVLSDQERKSIARPYRKIKTINLSENDSFRKFAKGRSKTMDAIKLIALDIWLTEKDDRWSQLTANKLRGLNDYAKVAASLEYFLFENNSESPALNVENFSGEYEGIYCVETNQKNTVTQLSLTIEKSPNPHVVTATVEENRVSKKPYLTEQNINSSVSAFSNNLTGWIVLSPEDNIVCYLKNIDTGSNRIYYLIAINESVFNGEKADCLAFLDRQVPSEISDCQKSSDFSTYLINWAKENRCNLMIFHRR